MDEYTPGNMRSLVVGAETKIPLLNGTSVTAVNFDNAASTPPFNAVMNAIQDYAPWYASVHRGKGYKSNYSTNLYENIRKNVGAFVKADPERDTVIFTKNTTESVNILAHAMGQSGDARDTVMITEMEHAANDLPWRVGYRTICARVDGTGRLSLDQVESLLKAEQGRVFLVAVTGASNVTGYINPVYDIAILAHAYGARIFVDAAQWVPHDAVDMRPWDDPEHIDFLAFSGHKMYAPFGAGVLIGPKSAFGKGSPYLAGGGAIGLVSPHFVQWKEPPERYEAGTPCLMGAVAIDAAIRTLEAAGPERIHDHERQLFDYAYAGLNRIPGVTIYCGGPCQDRRIGIIPINLDGMHHTLLAEILSYEAGIAVRDGLFCAHPYCERLLKLGEGELQKYFEQPELKKPGMVRISFGLYNETQEIDRLLHALSAIALSRDYYIKKYSGARVFSFCGQ
jgi:cysteine desulfurase/selenocysteine lyase